MVARTTAERVASARRDLVAHGATLDNVLSIAGIWAIEAYGMSASERKGLAKGLKRLAVEIDVEPGPVLQHFERNLAVLLSDVRSGIQQHATNGSPPMSKRLARSRCTHDDGGVIRVTTLPELFAAADDSVPFLLEGIVPAIGITTLVGASGSGKTHLDRAWLRALAGGEESMGGLALPGTEVRVLLVSEWSQSLLATTLLKYWGKDCEGLPIDIITAKTGLAAWETAARMVDDLIKLQRRERYGLINIDTVRTFGRLRDENDNAELSRVMVEFLRLADEGVALRLSHHTPKKAGPSTSPQLACAGAHAIPSLSTQTVSLWRKGNTTTLWSAGDVVETKHSMRWDEEAGIFLPAGARGKSSEGSRERAEQLALEAARALDALDPAAWHSKTAIEGANSGRSVRHTVFVEAIDRLAESGQLDVNDEDRYPRYRIPQAGGPA